MEDVTHRQPCDDGSDVVKMCTVVDYTLAVYVCPANAPESIRGKHPPVHTDADPQPERRARLALRDEQENAPEPRDVACAEADRALAPSSPAPGQ